MTSKEIEEVYIPDPHPAYEIFWLKEIALQIAKLREDMDGLREQVADAQSGE